MLMERSTTRFSLPNNFTPAGVVAEAELATSTPFSTGNGKRVKGARGAGLAYERKAHGYLSERYPYLYIPGPWLRFRNPQSYEWRYCQPDGFILDLQKLHLTLIEIKLKHTQFAWWQLLHLYAPVLRKLFGKDFSYSCCEVVKWFDPHTPFPGGFRCSPEVHQPRAQEFRVHIWNGKS